MIVVDHYWGTSTFISGTINITTSGTCTFSVVSDPLSWSSVATYLEFPYFGPALPKKNWQEEYRGHQYRNQFTKPSDKQIRQYKSPAKKCVMDCARWKRRRFVQKLVQNE